MGVMRVKVETARFGCIEVSDRDILRFPRGLLAFEEIGEYVLIPHGEGSPFSFLQAVSQAELAFVVTNPLWLRPDYRVDVYREDLDDLEIKEDDPVSVLAIVTVPRDGGEITVNLLAPILINERSRLGKQLVQNESSYRTRHILKEELARARRMAPEPAVAQGGLAPQLRTVG